MKLEQKDISGMLEAAIVAARLGGQRAMELITYTKSSLKSEDEIVTEADTQCQQIIIERIKENYPDHGFIAEEGRTGSIFKQPPRSSEPIWWVIDPIDGTNNFAHQLLAFSVSVAVMYEGEPVVGVIFEPATESLFTAAKGSEAQFNTRRITAGEEKISRLSCFAIDSNFTSGIPAWVIEMMKRTRFRNLGTTALQLAYVAKGSLIGVVNSSAKLWDIAAGVFIAETAGAVVGDWGGRKIWPVDCEKYNGEKFQILAANKKAHQEIAKLIAK